MIFINAQNLLKDYKSFDFWENILDLIFIAGEFFKVLNILVTFNNTITKTTF